MHILLCRNFDLKNKQINFFAIANESEYFYIGQPILIMDSCYKYINDEHVRYTINSYDDLKRYMLFNRKITVHINIDTGMNRTGIRTLEEYLLILKEIKNCNNIVLE